MKQYTFALTVEEGLDIVNEQTKILNKKKKDVIVEKYWNDAGVLDVINLHIESGFTHDQIYNREVINGHITLSRSMRAMDAAYNHWKIAGVLEVIDNHEYNSNFDVREILEASNEFKYRRICMLVEDLDRKKKIDLLMKSNEPALRIFSQQLKLVKY